jgi:hypothetical protein
MINSVIACLSTSCSETVKNKKDGEAIKEELELSSFA